MFSFSKQHVNHINRVLLPSDMPNCGHVCRCTPEGPSQYWPSWRCPGRRPISCLARTPQAPSCPQTALETPATRKVDLKHAQAQREGVPPQALYLGLHTLQRTAFNTWMSVKLYSASASAMDTAIASGRPCSMTAGYQAYGMGVFSANVRL